MQLVKHGRLGVSDKKGSAVSGGAPSGAAGQPIGLLLVLTQAS